MQAWEAQSVLDGIARSALSSPSAEAFEDAFAMLSVLGDARPRERRAYSRWFRELAEARVAECADAEEAGRLVKFVEAVLRMNARDDFDSYMLFMEWNREPQKQFYRPRRAVLLPLVGDLQDLFDGRLDFLSISMPPRTGKSTMCIFFLTFVMGNRPQAANVMSGHSDKLTKGFHLEALSIVTDPAYRFSEVFPDAPLVDKSMADETINLKRKNRFPSLTCRSIDGTLTGAVEVGRGALLYCDDLVSDREEALNADRMDKVYQAYLNQLKDRMNDGARQLFVATRWVPDDPIGRIEEQYGDNPSYRFVKLPALDGEGNSNFEYMYGLGFSTAYYEDMRDSLVRAGEGDSWAAKYMGEPEYIGGLMFGEGELLYFDELPEGEPDAVIAACDTKDKGKDYACLPVACVFGDKYYISDVVCDNSLPEVVEPRIVDAMVRNRVALARFESNSAGGRVADDVKRACLERGHLVEVRKKFSTENKETRILVDSLWIKAHCIFRREPDTPDYARFMSMLTHYTTEGRNKHDDAPDAMSMLKRLATSMRAAPVRAVRRPF